MMQAQQPLEELTPAQSARIAALTARFHRELQRDVAVLGSVNRVLRAPHGVGRVEAEEFRELIRGVVREELKNNA